MDPVPLSILVSSGSVCAFLSGLVTGYSTSEPKDDHPEENEPHLRLLSLKERFDELPGAFFALEMLFYTFAAIWLGLSLNKDSDIISIAIAGIILILIALVLRTVFFSIAKKFSTVIAPSLSAILIAFYYIVNPLSSLLQFIARKITGKEAAEISREEINAMIDNSREDGALDAGEYRILKNMMLFSSILVSDVMTPRTVIFSCKADNTVDDIINLPELRMYSRFPIWEGDSLDNGVIGYVMTKDVMNAALEGNGNKKLRDFLREAYYIPENAELDNALDRFLQRRQHLFVVVDEYGGVEGLLTMEDVLETILGVEIVDEADRVVDLRAFAKQARDKRIESAIKYHGG